MTWLDWVGRRRLLLFLAAAAVAIAYVFWSAPEAAVFLTLAFVLTCLIATAESWISYRLYRRRSASKRKETSR